MQEGHDDKVIITGIKPTGRPHLGNYLGMIQPAFELLPQSRKMYFIADAHALTTLHNPEKLSLLINEVAATWMALGLDGRKTILYRQSAIPEIFELNWVLACVTSKGLLNRAHAYKAAADYNVKAGHHADTNVNVGLFTYPLLMAADILSMNADLVPVGEDQRQHLEITRDIAAAFNRTFGQIFTLPHAMIRETVFTVPGLDGRKMSKSYENSIPILGSPEELRTLVMRIVTDSRQPSEPKDPEQCNVFALYRLFAPPEDVVRMRERYLVGGLAYKVVKEELIMVLQDRFHEARKRFADLMKQPWKVSDFLAQGAEAARCRASETLKNVRTATGI